MWGTREATATQTRVAEVDPKRMKAMCVLCHIISAPTYIRATLMLTCLPWIACSIDRAAGEADLPPPDPNDRRRVALPPPRFFNYSVRPKSNVPEAALKERNKKVKPKVRKVSPCLPF